MVGGDTGYWQGDFVFGANEAPGLHHPPLRGYALLEYYAHRYGVSFHNNEAHVNNIVEAIM